MSHRASPTSLDDTSRSIVELLQADGRRSYSDLGKEVGLSEAAVRQRVQRLTDSGAMQIVAIADPAQLGFRRQALVGLACSGDTVAIADALSLLNSVTSVAHTAGRFDLMIEVICESDGALISVLNDDVRSIAGVESTETFVYLAVRKQSHGRAGR
ncbi:MULTISPECIES: Lrp/AsnC family transcriptional regulator [Subtercola]|uniref:Lrp/AsnC family transcriptional regulator n=1 Tax=Subtercola vilae TaxID=2056433 RepID=A0A4T2BLC0_9MICO|nr:MULTISPECIES: Lrp/AsnC family transcriptional regulator [Subtercola]MEA9985175.1 Lrp/AsnC family transcriptional regulator [Subtercola sp. RTI3]TIH30106.1 Lrp/AsnC family transcriptional regulator [Subtercola vilae]